uniref:C-type lectin domain-containing protein n=1 Tax=Magallana gigas TaxID=29159 RepID=A0A8W8JAU1_MAGGI
MTIKSYVWIQLVFIIFYFAVYSSASAWPNTHEYNYSDYDPDTEVPAGSAPNGGTEDYSTPPDQQYVTKNMESKNPYVTRQPIPLKINNSGEYDTPKLNDIMNKINASKIMNNRYFSKNAKNKKRHSRKYDLGSNSGYKWMLYREPIAERKRMIKSNGFHSTKQKNKLVSRHPKPVLSKKSLKKLIKKLPKHMSRSSEYVVEKTDSSKYVVGKNLEPSLQLADFLRAGFPITVLINPTFRANNIQSASVLGYGLRSLLKHRNFSKVKHLQIPGNATLVHHIVKRSYHPKLHDHYRESRRRLHKRWGNYRTYYKTYLKSTNHVKGYNKRGYRLGSYRSGVKDKGLKRPPKPKRPKTFKLRTEEPHLGNNTCPYAWLEYEGSCYYFSRDELNWYKATMTCASMGGYVAVVNSAHENTYLRNFLLTNDVENGAWIGLNELSNTKIHRWRWGYSTKLCGEFDWFGEEPEFHSNKDYHCGVMWQTYKYHWHLENCFTEHFYVCEMKLGKPCKCQY